MDTSTDTPRGRGRPRGSKNRHVRGPNVRRAVPPLTPDELFEMKELPNFVPHRPASIDKMIREGRFPRPRFVGKKRVWTGQSLITYRACIARGEAWREPEQQNT